MDHKFKPFLDSLALIVSVAALITSIRLGTKAIDISNDSVAVSQEMLAAQREHDELSLRPMLDFQFKFGIGPAREDSGFLTLANVGEGPATITRITATHNGEPLQTDLSSLTAKSRRLGLIPHELHVGQIVGGGRAIMLFRIPAKDVPRGEVCADDWTRKNFFQQLQIVVEYESLYHKRDTAQFRYRSTNTSDCARRVDDTEKGIKTNAEEGAVRRG